MSGPIDEREPDLRRMLALTAAGRRAVEAPQLGLTISQRWLLARIGGGASLAAIGASAGASAQVVRLPRDAAKLVGLGLAVDVGEPGPVLFAATTRSGELTGPAPLAIVSASTPADASLDVGLDDARARRARPRAAGLVLIVSGLAGAAYWAVRPGDAPTLVATQPSPAAAVAAKPRPAPTARAPVDEPAQRAAASRPADRESAPSAVAVGADIGTTASPPIDAARATAVPEVPESARASAAKPAPPQKAALAAAPPPVLRLRPTPAPANGEALAERLAAGPAPATPTPSTTLGLPAVAATPLPSPAPPPTAPEIVATAPTSAEVGGARPVVAAPLVPLSRSTPAYPRDVADDTRREVSFQAQLIIGASGEVTRVEFPGSTSRNQPYERVARRALMQWRFPAGTADRSYRTELSFKPE